MNQKLLLELNNLLGRELGRNVYGDPLFKWEHSDVLMWPAFRTGRSTKRIRTFKVPIFGGGEGEANEEIIEPEYKQDRQCRKSAWFMTKWLTARELIVGGFGRGAIAEPADVQNATDEFVERLWQSRFPGADFPSRGWRVATDASLPRSPVDPIEPNLPDTEYFVRCFREQTSMSPEMRLADMLDAMKRDEQAPDKRIGDEVRDAFPAFLNPNPGKRGGFVSVPDYRRVNG